MILYKKYIKFNNMENKATPTSHAEWADMFNKVGKVNLIIIESKRETQIH